ncbi:Putative retroelement [Phytophthora palmivora]|uniref:Retroelement n=1 Tax=Phytophthora palmivora TaxID=4796 RepID=A0A2P4YG33_9STRA|nr:Putative retroelement [Phytophthora palmivora]
MSGCTLYSALDLVDGDATRAIECPATFNRLVSKLLRPFRAFVQTYFDDTFHSRAGSDQTAIEVHLMYISRVFEVMRANKIYANIGNVGVRTDPGKVKSVAAGPISRSQIYLRKWLGLTYYLHKYSAASAILTLPDENKSFSVVCGASDYAIGCALLQKDDEGRERVISFQSRQLKAAERNYPVHDKELLAVKYALVKVRVHFLGFRPFVIYTDHASLRAATNSPHISQRMAKWLSFFAEYNFRVEYKPGKLNVLADALSRRPDYELAHVSRVTTDLYNRIRLAYQEDENYTPLVQFLSDGKDAKVDRLSPRQRAQLHRYELAEGFLHYRVNPRDPPRVVVPNDEDLKYDILPEAHDAPISGHLGREKTYQMVCQTFRWPHMYKWVTHYVMTCETKDFGPHLGSTAEPTYCWKSMSLDFAFGLPADGRDNTGISVFVCRLSKMVHLAPVRDKGTGKQAALNSVFRYHGLPETIVSDRDPHFAGAFWGTLLQLLGTKLTMSTADHPQTDGQTERVNSVLEDTLRRICAEAPRSWSDQLPMVECALNNVVHTSTGFTLFYPNGI